MSEFNLEVLGVSSPVKKVKELVPTIQNAILDGTVDPAKAGIILKKYSKLFEEIFKGDLGETVKDLIYDATLSYREGNKKTISLLGANITAGAVRTWYDYSNCGDPLWNELDRLEKSIKDLKKSREEQLKGLMPPDTQLELGIANTSVLIPYELKVLKRDNKSPIVATVNPPIKRSIDGLKYSV